MTHQELYQLAREYADHKYKIAHEASIPKSITTEEITAFLQWLSSRYCFVEKEDSNSRHKMIKKRILHTYDPAPGYGQAQVAPEPAKISEKEFDEIISNAIVTYGPAAQTQMLFEEMAELQNALCKLARGRGTVEDVCEEIADVMIMCAQMAKIYGPKAVEQMKEFKILRLKDRLNTTKK